MTQAPVATWAGRGEELRAARWLGWVLVLRPLALLGVASLGPRLAVAWLGLALAFGLGAGRLRISPGATFLVRRPRGLGDVLADAVGEGTRMLRAYALAVLACALAGGLAWALPPPPAWLGLLGLLVPVELLAAAPVLVAWGLQGAHPALLLGVGAGALVCARRPDRLARGYLRVESWGRWRALRGSFVLASWALGLVFGG